MSIRKFARELAEIIGEYPARLVMVDVGREVCPPHKEPKPTGRVTGMEVVKRYAEEVGIPYTELLGDSRRAVVARHRQEAYWLVHEQCPHLSLTAIGRLFGGRDHSTIHYGIGRHKERLAWAAAQSVE